MGLSSQNYICRHCSSIANTHTGTPLYTCPSGLFTLRNPYGYSTCHGPHRHSTSHSRHGHSNPHSPHWHSTSHSPHGHSNSHRPHGHLPSHSPHGYPLNTTSAGIPSTPPPQAFHYTIATTGHNLTQLQQTLCDHFTLHGPHEHRPSVQQPPTHINDSPVGTPSHTPTNGLLSHSLTAPCLAIAQRPISACLIRCSGRQCHLPGIPHVDDWFPRTLYFSTSAWYDCLHPTGSELIWPHHAYNRSRELHNTSPPKHSP